LRDEVSNLRRHPVLCVQEEGMVLEMLDLEDALQVVDIILTIGWQLFVIANEANFSNGGMRGEERNVGANLNLGCYLERGGIDKSD
jgi:hypothetical protein